MSGKRIPGSSLRRAGVVAAAVAVGLPAVTYTSVEATSVPNFCSSCHEIKPAVLSWKRSAHATTKDGKRAACRDCHVPSWSHPLDAVWLKMRHGIRDTYSHLAIEREPDFYFRAKEQALANMDDAVCLRCHEQILDSKDVIEDAEGPVRGLHSSAEAKKLSCMVCHKNTGHGPFE